jgi:uncharacterized membrane protein YphA (DoxX/SURF4 family)
MLRANFNARESSSMNMDVLRTTTDNNLAGVVRILLGLLFLMTGVMKLAVPMLADAWSGQLIAAELPFYTLTRWAVPFLEIAMGGLLVVGAYARVAALQVIGTMVVATYVHLKVDDPSLFPLQPTEPIIPAVVIVLAAYVLWRGSGAWSLDHKASSS